MKVLVTGGAGYIGSHVCKALAQAGHEPIAYDNLSTGHSWAVKWGPLVEADLADGTAIRAAIRQYRPTAVIHLAASAYVGESMLNPRKYFENNTGNALNLLGAMLDEGIGRVVFSSTCATYGVPSSLPITEEHPQHPVNPYGSSKLMIEKFLEWYGRVYGIRYVVLRYFNAAGADVDGDIGEAHNPETHLIPIALDSVRGLRPGVEVFGTDYPTPDGTAIRDYVHVADLADAHAMALQYLGDGGASTALNLGTGQGHSVRQVITAVERVAGVPVSVRELQRRLGDPPILVARVDEARTVLGWSPKFTRLDDIVASALRWAKGQSLARDVPPRLHERSYPA